MCVPEPKKERNTPIVSRTFLSFFFFKLPVCRILMQQRSAHCIVKLKRQASSVSYTTTMERLEDARLNTNFVTVYLVVVCFFFLLLLFNVKTRAYIVRSERFSVMEITTKITIPFNLALHEGAFGEEPINKRRRFYDVHIIRTIFSVARERRVFLDIYR